MNPNLSFVTGHLDPHPLSLPGKGEPSPYQGEGDRITVRLPALACYLLLVTCYSRGARLMFKPVPTRVDYVQLEHEVQAWWDEHDTIAKYLRAQPMAPTKRWSFIDGPITANNPMGVHHAWGRTYKDLYQRFKTMQGLKQRYQNGFDCQGLWIEVEVEKELGFTVEEGHRDASASPSSSRPARSACSASRDQITSSRSASATGWTGTTATTRTRTRTTTRSGASSRSAGRTAGSTRARTACPGAPLRHRHLPARDRHRGLPGDHAPVGLPEVPDLRRGDERRSEPDADDDLERHVPARREAGEASRSSSGRRRPGRWPQRRGRGAPGPDLREGASRATTSSTSRKGAVATAIRGEHEVLGEVKGARAGRA